MTYVVRNIYTGRIVGGPFPSHRAATDWMAAKFPAVGVLKIEVAS